MIKVPLFKGDLGGSGLGEKRDLSWIIRYQAEPDNADLEGSTSLFQAEVEPLHMGS